MGVFDRFLLGTAYLFSNPFSFNQNDTARSFDLPIVDLGYAKYQASSHNQNFNFSNIRYAAPPIGDLRFTAPQPPLQTDPNIIHDGSYGFNCPQSMAAWVVTLDYRDGSPLNQTGNITYEIPPHAGDENEDCLFLDVVVPKEIYYAQNVEDDNHIELRKKKIGSGAPVLVWVYGGAYVMGSKSYYGTPTGLLAHSKEAGRQGFVYVAFNYRVSSELTLHC